MSQLRPTVTSPRSSYVPKHPTFALGAPKGSKTISTPKSVALHLSEPGHIQLAEMLVALTLKEEETCVNLSDVGGFADVSTGYTTMTMTAAGMAMYGASAKYPENRRLDTTDIAYAFGEDHVRIVHRNAKLWAVFVFDGHSGPETALAATKKCVDVFKECDFSNDFAQNSRAAKAAYVRLNHSIRPDVRTSGSTMVALLFTDTSVHCLSSGDSAAHVKVGDTVFKMSYSDDYDNVPVGDKINGFSPVCTSKKERIPCVVDGEISPGFQKIKNAVPFGFQGVVKHLHKSAGQYTEDNPLENFGCRGHTVQICSSLGDLAHNVTGEVNPERCFYSELKVSGKLDFMIGTDGICDFLFPHEYFGHAPDIVGNSNAVWTLLKERLKLKSAFTKRKNTNFQMFSDTRTRHDDVAYISGSFTSGSRVVPLVCASV